MPGNSLGCQGIRQKPSTTRDVNVDVDAIVDMVVFRVLFGSFGTENKAKRETSLHQIDKDGWIQLCSASAAETVDLPTD